MNRCVALLLGCLWSLIAAAGPNPIWSVQVAQSLADPQPLNVDELTLLPDGSAYFLGHAPEGSADYSSLRLADGGTLQRGQFVDDQFPSPEYFPKIIARAADRVLLGIEGQAGASSIYLVETSGRVLWAQRWDARSARFLANGDLILQAEQQLLRLRGSDGGVVWTRNLLDLHPFAFNGGFVLGDEVDTQVDVAASLFVSETPLAPWRALGFQFAFDPANGDLRWAQPQEQAATGVLYVFVGCPTSQFADSIVQVWGYSTGTATRWVIESRRRVDGALRWTVGRPEGPVEESCTLLATPSGVYLALREDYSSFSISALDAASGRLRWQQNMPGVLQMKLLEGADGNLLAAQGERDAQDVYRTRFSSYRAGDGGTQWEFVVPGYKFDWQRRGTDLLLATTPVPDNIPRARREVRDAASGALRSADDADLTGRVAPVHATGFVGDAACHALVDPSNAVDLRCLDGISGSPRWTRQIPPLAPGDITTSVQIGALAAGRVRLAITFSRTVGAELQHWARVIAVDGATGVALWELPSERYILSNLAADDGGAILTSFSCPTPPACTDGTQYLRRFAGADGALLWSRELPGPHSSLVLATRGSTLVNWRYTGSNRGLFAGVDAHLGGDRWEAQANAGTVVQPTALVTAGGHVVVKQEAIAGTSREIELRGLDPVTGAQRWLLVPGVPHTRSWQGILSELPGDTALVTGMRNFSEGNRNLTGPWLAAVDAASGSLRWEHAPGVGRDGQRLVRAVRATAGGVRLVNQVRTFGSLRERRALSSFAPESGDLGGEHLYASAPGFPQDRFGEFRVGASLADDSVLVESFQGRVDGDAIPSLQRLPAPIGPEGDLEVSVANSAPITALGPTTVVEVRVENHSAHAISELRAGFIYPYALRARFLDCVAIAGSSTCAAEVDGPDDALVYLGPGAIALIRYEMFTASYSASRRGNVETGHFYVDTPYDFGDTDLGNNIVEVGVSLGGMPSGFE